LQLGDSLTHLAALARALVDEIDGLSRARVDWVDVRLARALAMNIVDVLNTDSRPGSARSGARDR
jgi:hypothetical protein